MNIEKTTEFTASGVTKTGCELVDSIEGLRLRRLARASRTHRELYEDLTEAFQHAHAIKRKPASQDVLRSVLNNRKLKFDTIEKCIKHVIEREFGESERQRTFVYRRALQVAVENQIQSDRLAEWLATSGGVDKIATENPVRPRTDVPEREVQTTDAIDRRKDFLFEVDIPSGIDLKEGRHVAVLTVSGSKIQFVRTSTDYKMWASVQRRFEVLRQPLPRKTDAATKLRFRVQKSTVNKAKSDLKKLLKIRN